MKIQKVFKNGVFLKEIYPYATWFQVQKFRLAQWIGKIIRSIVYWLKLGLTATVAMAVGAFMFGNYTGATTSVIMAENNENVPLKIQELKDQLANIVHQGESDGRNMHDGEIFSVFDPSDAMKGKCLKANTIRPIDCESYGPYQEKIGTIMYYAPKVYGKEVNQMEAMTIANDGEKAKDFFLKCSIKVQGCAWNWTAAKNNRDQVELLVNVIRSLEKV